MTKLSADENVPVEAVKALKKKGLREEFVMH